MFGSSAGSTIFNALYFKSASSQSWCSRHWVRLPQMEITRDKTKPPMKRRIFFEVGSKWWVTTFFWGDLFITSSLSCNVFEKTSFPCLICLTASTKNLLRCSFLPSSTQCCPKRFIDTMNMRLLWTTTPSKLFGPHLYHFSWLWRRCKWFVQPLSEFNFRECVQSKWYDKIGDSPFVLCNVL